MVARIAHSTNVSKILNYNEKKVSRDDAELIHSSGFLKNTDRLNFYEKVERFNRLNELRPRVELNMLHISVNFDPSEKLSKTQLAAIADRYMEGIGFKEQPYLVYQHNDAGHPHLHIVTNVIQADGKPIVIHNLGKMKSEPTRKEIEKEFGLVRAEDSRRLKQRFELQPVDAQKVIYGTATETKSAMKQAIHEVFSKYKYTSLPEYNAALRLFNITADPGGKDSRIRKHGGLVYRVFDEQGNKVGVPIKASAFHFKPTLKNLKKNFEKNAADRQIHLQSIRDRIDVARLQNADSLREFVADLSAVRIEVVIRQTESGMVYGLTYVDKQTKTVINGSDLGKKYSAASILRQIEHPNAKKPEKHPTKHHSPDEERLKNEKEDAPSLPRVPGFNLKTSQVLSTLMQYDQSFGRSPYELEEEQKTRRHRLR
jgi:Relaxase/Mobilisation nuclease domain